MEFAPISDSEIRWYIESGEPRDKAGAYAMQGLASRFVTRIDGSYSNVVGLPVALRLRDVHEGWITGILKAFASQKVLIYEPQSARSG